MEVGTRAMEGFLAKAGVVAEDLGVKEQAVGLVDEEVASVVVMVAVAMVKVEVGGVVDSVARGVQAMAVVGVVMAVGVGVAAARTSGCRQWLFERPAPACPRCK